ncbi:MAG: dihydroorotate dehydrogenase electron transfer subunit [Desulfopila sp.]|jgi:dihydroorotate dehydrogenase electron transfer subunit|nr:dihydroorotate dehydrogenase electron transfer subunit [Desulfopila sp.]
MSQYQENATIIRFEQLTADNIRLTLESENIAACAKPGQFVMIRTATGKDPILRRPFSIHQASTNGRIQILFKITGRGTGLLAHSKVGERLSVFGPLGHGFEIREDRPACLVGGGMGIAPMLFLAKKISILKKDSANDHIIFGGRTRQEVEPLVNDFEQIGMRLVTATDDGSYGKKGFVTEVIQTLSLARETVVYACGPDAMMKQLHIYCQVKKMECQVSVESVMACGMGACLGCNIPAKDGHYVHVCYEGPVFNAEELAWK